MARDEGPKSKLIKLLKLVSRGTTPRIGLLPATQAASVPAMALIVAIEQPDAQKIAAAVAGGADAIAVTGSQTNERWTALLQAAGNKPVGVYLTDDVASSASELQNALALQPDFVMADASTAPASLLPNKDVGVIVSLDESYPAQMVRALGELTVAAVLAEMSGEAKIGTLTVHDLLHYRQVVDLVHRPVIVAAEGRVDEQALQPLRDMGVEGLLLRLPAIVKPDELQSRVEAYQTAIGSLGRSIGRGREGGPSVMVPRLPGQAPAEAEEEPDDE